MNKQALREMANFLDTGNIDEGDFNMKCYFNCVLGHTARREAKRHGIQLEYGEVVNEAPAEANRVYQITRDTDAWDFAFAPQWGFDRHAAATRLRYLADHDKAPPKSQWKTFLDSRQPELVLRKKARPLDIMELEEA